MVIFSNNPMIILLQVIVFLLIINPSFSSYKIDPDTKSFIQTICIGTENKDACESIFTHNLPDPETDPLGLTREAIDTTLRVLHENVDYIQSVNENMKIKTKTKSCFDDEAKMNWELIEVCGRSYSAMKMEVEEVKKGIIDPKNIKSMAKVGKSFAKLQKLGDYEMVKCENAVENTNYYDNYNYGFDLIMDLNSVKFIISDKNRDIGLLIEMVASAGENLVKVMDIGAEETEDRYGFLQYLFYS